VACTVFAPPVVRPGSSALVQVFLHLREEQAAIARTAKEYDDQTIKRGETSLGTRLWPGTNVTIELRFTKLTVCDSIRRVEWQGQSITAGFAVDIPKDLDGLDLVGTVIISQDSVPIGTIVFKIGIALEGNMADRRPMGLATRYSQAFISYARADAAEVYRRVQMLAAAGIRFFHDVFHLQPGERWSPKIQEAIDGSDVMFLFWSTAAKESTEVEKEWRYGLERKGVGYIRPICIEGPPIPSPPQELADIHFGDSVYYLIPVSLMRRLRNWLKSVFWNRLRGRSRT
jgi:hypothetical protein